MRGQYFSFDAIIASVIFILALVALISYWYSVRSFLDFQNDQLSKDAVRVSNLLFTPAAPSSDCATMTRLGYTLGWDDRRVDEAVITCSRAQSQDWLREKLGTPFGVSLNVTNLANNSVTTIGGNVPSTAANVFKIRRLATVVNSTNGTYLAAFDLSIYR